MSYLPIAEWLPDTPNYEQNGSLEALNVVPRSKSYGPFPSFVSLTSALNARCQGAFFARKSDGTGIMFAGTATKLYSIVGTTITDVTRLAGGAYNCPSDGQWSFAQFGNIVYAVNGSDNMQKFNFDSDANFTLNTGSPPVCTYITVAGDFLMTGNQTSNRSLVQWSSINDPTASWAASQTTQANNQTLPDGGWIKGIIGLEYSAVIFQEFAIRLATYVGTPLIFRFNKIADNIGCQIPGTVARYRDLMFWYDQTGFYMMQGGVQITPIGEQRVNQTFAALADANNYSKVSAGIDPRNALYIVGFADTAASPAGTINHLYAYSWTIDRWAHAQPGNLEFIFSAANQTSFTLEQLDALPAFSSGGIDQAGAPSLDDSSFVGVANRLLGGFDTSHTFGFFNGPALAATVDTTEVNIIEGQKSFVRSVRPLVEDGSSVTVALGYRDRINDMVNWTAAVPENTYGYCAFRNRARYHRARIQTAAGDTFDHIQGVDDIHAVAGGNR